MNFGPNLRRLGRQLQLATTAAVLFGTTVGRAADDGFFEPSPIVQAVAAVEQGELERGEALVGPLAESDEATAEACSLLGQIRVKQGRAPEAVLQFERAIAKSPTSAQMIARLGDALLIQAEGAEGETRAPLLQRAREVLERAVAVDAGCFDAQMGLVRFHLLVPEAGAAGAVERHAEAAAKLDPLEANYAIGDLAEKHGRIDLAERYFGAIAELLPAIPWLRFKHAVALAKLGRLPEARGELETLLKAFPGFGPAQQALSQLPAQ